MPQAASDLAMRIDTIINRLLLEPWMSNGSNCERLRAWRPALLINPPANWMLTVECVTGYQVIRVIRIFAKTYPFE